MSQNPEDMKVLFTFLSETADRNGFNRQQDDYLMQVAKTLMPGRCRIPLYCSADRRGWFQGAYRGGICLRSDDTRTYAHAAASFAHRSSRQAFR